MKIWNTALLPMRPFLRHVLFAIWPFFFFIFSASFHYFCGRFNSFSNSLASSSISGDHILQAPVSKGELFYFQSLPGALAPFLFFGGALSEGVPASMVDLVFSFLFAISFFGRRRAFPLSCS